MQKKLLFVVLILHLSSFSYSQNLVPNASFEEYTQCPELYNDIRYVANWENSSEFSSDYFNTCKIDCVYVYRPFGIKNYKGAQKPKTGEGYAGFFAYPEFLTSKLLSRLQEDSVYYVEAFVSLADKTNKAAMNFGFLFSEEEITTKNIDEYKSKAQIIIPEFIVDKKNWVKISGTIKATGREEYITIGCFIEKRKEIIVDPKKKNTFVGDSPYYYLDDVKVVDYKELLRIPDGTLHFNDSVKSHF